MYRLMLDDRVFQLLHRQLHETRLFHVTRHDAGCRTAVCSPNLEESILNVVADRPGSSTKAFANHVNVQNGKLGGHQTCLSINRLWHELCDMLRHLVGTTAPAYHDCSVQE
ncbi:hypothetical protein TNCV_1495371 [Trichonephila clavipes]|nr:hypothetical protein TNCV_1495371 [Trichonephila clavipes]